MKRTNILSRLEKCGVIAVVRASNCEEAINACYAIVDGGIQGLEITFTIPNAEKAISTLVDHYKNSKTIIIGAGTILDAITARIAIMAGAQYIVSPSFDKETAELCNLYQIPYLPGCMTITEMKEALKSGVDIIKLFPGSTFSPSIISSFKAPLPQLNIMPTGGVNLDNLEDWFNEGAFAVGVGGNLLAPAETGDFEKVTEIAKKYIQKFNEVKGL